MTVQGFWQDSPVNNFASVEHKLPEFSGLPPLQFLQTAWLPGKYMGYVTSQIP